MNYVQGHRVDSYVDPTQQSHLSLPWIHTIIKTRVVSSGFKLHTSIGCIIAHTGVTHANIIIRQWLISGYPTTAIMLFITSNPSNKVIFFIALNSVNYENYLQSGNDPCFKKSSSRDGRLPMTLYLHVSFLYLTANGCSFFNIVVCVAIVAQSYTFCLHVPFVSLHIVTIIICMSLFVSMTS